MFPRGVITPASPAAPSRDEARALLAPEEERLLESNVSAKRTGALTWTLRGLGAVAVVSGVVAVASIAGPGRDAASAVLSPFGSPSCPPPFCPFHVLCLSCLGCYCVPRYRMRLVQ